VVGPLIAARRKAARPLRSEPNRFGLPQGEPIRRALVRAFRQLRADLAKATGLRLGRKDQTPPDLPPNPGPVFDRAQEWADLMTPLIEAIWDQAGTRFAATLGLDPDQWDVTRPELAAAIRQQAFDFCQTTLDTTQQATTDAYEATRRALVAGVLDTGDSVADLTKRLQTIFTGAETWKARQIAATEASRAVHAAQVMQAQTIPGVVQGWRWLLSSDACPICQTISAEVGAVRLGGVFARIGNNPTYAAIQHPPAHPGCQCSLEAVLYDDPDGVPAFSDNPYVPGATQPEPAKPEPAPPSPVRPAPRVDLAIAGAPSPEFVDTIQATVDKLTPGVRRRLARAGVTPTVAARFADVLPDTAHQQPRGWPAGMTWAHTDGGYIGLDRKPFVAEFCLASGSATQEVPSKRGPGVIRHEIGHAIDEAGRRRYVSSSRRYLKAYREDVAGLSDHAGLGYFLQSGTAGPEETFAEMFAQLAGGGSGKTDIINRFPRVAALVRIYTR
jgi:hypothetical protein